MLARSSGQTVGSTIAKLQRLRYDEDFELLTEQFADVLAEGDHPPADLTLDLLLSRFPSEMINPILKEDFGNWGHARKTTRYKSEQARKGVALLWINPAGVSQGGHA